MSAMHYPQLLVSLLLLAQPQAAAAASPPRAESVPVMSIRLRVADLDLSTEEGRHGLESRIRAAARRVCWISSSGHLLDRRALEADCVRDATATAWQAVLLPARQVLTTTAVPAGSTSR